ncbi:type VI secretion system Vgr family protein [Alkalimarinus sediminis]|uniref:Type VI secretion system tip protein VgrG n=1 Tax=Alkalimarinus sediminis TaxID=1632866 RepID=A0A9E8HQ16_9ALTE|nr:type VI secretion system tip protein TssI/VgrG [Alkalimarinus sediminis]UZW73709.1 type VI secretion system tip protein VgrG [Alkalimarinus sediminis]
MSNLTPSVLHQRHWNARLMFSVAGINDLLRVVHFDGHEAISSLYEYSIDIACENDSLSLNDLIGRQATFQIKDDKGHSRTIMGAVYGVTQGAIQRRFAFYTFKLVPQFKWLQHRHGCRIFQDQDVATIVQQIFDEAGLDSQSYRFELSSHYPQREYCVQYDENEWHFVSRLLEEEGIHFHFEQSERQPIMVISDNPSSFRPLTPTREIRFQGNSGQAGDQATLHVLSWNQQVTHDQITFNDYNYEKPNRSLLSSAQDESTPKLESYSYPGGYKQAEEGDRLSKVELARDKVASCKIEAKGTVCFFSSGSVFTLAQHPRDDYNVEFLVTAIKQSGDQPQVLEEQSGSGGYQFKTTVSCLPSTMEYRPQRTHRKPVIKGAQTAVVYGAPGESIYTDELGRIKVNFHWERENKSSCWLRVSQAWAGNQWGTVSLPRVGQEVIVDFVDGNPDTPLVTGCVYHNLHKPPYKLPDHKTRTTFKSQSVPAGGFNELRVEDKKGHEQIFVQAQKDLDLKILQDHKTHVGGSSHLIVDRDQCEQINGEFNQSVTGDIKVQTQAGHHLTINGDRQDKIAGSIKQQAGGDVHIKSGNRVILDAGVELTIQAGGAFIKLSPAGVQIQGATINLNGGGSAGPASAASPTAPSPAIEVVREGAGKNSEISPEKAQFERGELAFTEAGQSTINKRVHLKALVANSQLLADECMQDENGQCAKLTCTCVAS